MNFGLIFALQSTALIWKRSQHLFFSSYCAKNHSAEQLLLCFSILNHSDLTDFIYKQRWKLKNSPLRPCKLEIRTCVLVSTYVMVKWESRSPCATCLYTRECSHVQRFAHACITHILVSKQLVLPRVNNVWKLNIQQMHHNTILGSWQTENTSKSYRLLQLDILWLETRLGHTVQESLSVSYNLRSY